MKSLSERSEDFAVQVIRLYSRLPADVLTQTLGRQLLRSGTSVGAHLSEGKRSRSRAEIISKTEVALQELEESTYWMRLFSRSGILPPANLSDLMAAADELTAMLVSGVNRLKGTKHAR